MLEVRNGLRRMLVALCWGAALLSPPAGLAQNAAEPAARDTLRVGYFALEGFNQKDCGGPSQRLRVRFAPADVALPQCEVRVRGL